MSFEDENRADFYADCWHSAELSASEQEAILRDKSQHQFLKQVWDSGYDFPDWLAADSIPEHTLIDVVGAGKLAIVCRAIHNDGQIHCVKIANYDEHPEQLREKLADSIRNEARVLMRLPEGDLKFGILPTYVDRGEKRINGQESPYLITRYCFGLRNVTQLYEGSQRTETSFWLATAKLLGEVHKRGIVHGDIHESNLFLDAASRPVLLDFGNSQVRKRYFLQTRSTQRHFGPAVAMHTDEVASPYDRLLPAFDVMCLMEVANSRLASYFEEGNWQLGTDGASNAGDRYHALLRACRSPAPELRPANGLALAKGLQEVTSGARLTFRPDWRAHARVILRRYPRFLAALAILCILLCSAIGSLLLRQAQLREAARRDAVALEKLKASNSIAIGSIQDFLEASSQQDELLEEVPGTSRTVLAERIETLLSSDVLTLDARIATLGIGLSLANAAMEFDGGEAALPIARMCVEESKKLVDANQGFRERLFEIQSTAILSKILYDRGGLVESKSAEAVSLAQIAADSYLRVGGQSLTDVERTHYCETAIDLARYALYPQRAETWFKHERGERLWLILDRAIIAASADEANQITQYAELQRLYGLAMHKGAFVESSRYPGDIDFAELTQRAYITALEDVSRHSGQVDGITVRQARRITARIKSVLGMSYTNQDRYEEAQEVLKDAYKIREVASKEFPGSQLRQREFISTGWNFADAIQREAAMRFDLPEASSIHRRELAIRLAVVKKCEELLERDRNSDSELDYLVNASRVALAYVMLKQFDDAYEQLSEVENRLGLEGFEYKRIGLESIVSLCVLSRFTPHEGYTKQLEFCLDQLNQQLDNVAATLSNDRKQRFSRHSQMFIHAAGLVQSPELTQQLGWDAFMSRMQEWQTLQSE